MRLMLAAILLGAPGLQADDVADLVKKLGSASFEEQGRAAKTLEALGPKALPALEKAAGDANAEVRDWAAKIRARIETGERKRREAETSAAKEAVARHVARLADPDYEVQGKAAEALKALGKEALPLLEDARTLASDGQVVKWLSRIIDGFGVTALGGGAGWKAAFSARKAPEAAVRSALQWLARHQNPNGGWGTSFPAQCTRGRCGGTGEKDHDAAVTGLALLAFLGAGISHLSTDEGADESAPGKVLRFGAAVEGGLKWLLAHQDNEGCLGGRGQKYMYNHAIATAALVEAYGMTGAERLKGPAQKAVDFLVAARNPGKGWRYSAGCGDDDTSVTGWAVMALKSAELSGATFPRAAYDGALAWIQEVTDDQFYVAGYNNKGSGKVFIPGKNEQFDHHPTMSAIGVQTRLVVTRNKSDPALAAVEMIAKDTPQWAANSVDFYYWYWGSLALNQKGGSDSALWKKWDESIRKALLPNQAKEGCAAGSWDPARDRWGCEGGRVSTTALGALLLETPTRYLRVFGGK